MRASTTETAIGTKEAVALLFQLTTVYSRVEVDDTIPLVTNWLRKKAAHPCEPRPQTQTEGMTAQYQANRDSGSTHPELGKRQTSYTPRQSLPESGEG
jgi:hypothetical protein